MFDDFTNQLGNSIDLIGTMTFDDNFNYSPTSPQTIENLRRENRELKAELKRLKGTLTFKEESISNLTDMFWNE